MSKVQYNYSHVDHDPAEHFDVSVGVFRGYISPIISILGIVGNILIIVVFSREVKFSRYSVYCIVLAVVHLIALFVNTLLDDFLGRGFAYMTGHSHSAWKLDLVSDVSCKLMEYFPNSMYFTASNLVVVFTVDRVLTIYGPIKYFSAYHLDMALMACSICFVSGLVLNIPLLISYRLITFEYHSPDGWRFKCDVPVSKKGTGIIAGFGLYTKIIGAFIIPTFVVLLLNFVIAYKLWLLHRGRRCFYNCRTEHRIKRSVTGTFFSKSHNNDTEMSRIFGHIAINSAFLCLTMPLVIVMILRLHSDSTESEKNDLYYYNSLKHLSRLFSSVKDINYAVNFFLYLTFLPNFNKGFFTFARKCCTGLRSSRNKSGSIALEMCQRKPKEWIVISTKVTKEACSLKNVYTAQMN